MAGEFSWWSIVPTLVGGSISLLTTVVMFNFARKTDRAEKEKSKRAQESLDAFFAFEKLLQAASFTINLAETIDAEFKEASDRGADETRESHEFVRPLILAAPETYSISVADCLFLAKGENFSFYTDFYNFLSRTKINASLVQAFNQEKRQYQDFLETLPHTVKGNTSVSTTHELEGADAVRALPRIGRLNNLLGILVEGLEKDRVTAKEVVTKFHELAKKEFGSDWRAKTVTWRNSNANP